MWTNAGILLIGPLGTNFSEILIEILTFSFKKMHLKVSSTKRRPFCLGLNVLTLRQPADIWPNGMRKWILVIIGWGNYFLPNQHQAITITIDGLHPLSHPRMLLSEISMECLCHLIPRYKMVILLLWFWTFYHASMSLPVAPFWYIFMPSLCFLQRRILTPPPISLKICLNVLWTCFHDAVAFQTPLVVSYRPQ